MADSIYKIYILISFGIESNNQILLLAFHYKMYFSTLFGQLKPRISYVVNAVQMPPPFRVYICVYICLQGTISVHFGLVICLGSA